MNLRNLFLSTVLAVLITGAFGLAAFLRRYFLSTAYELQAEDAAAFVLITIVLAAFLYLKVVGRSKA